MRSLFVDYPEACQAAINLFGQEKIEQERKKLELAYEVCEEAWERNLARLQSKSVKYLLVGEAPPNPTGDHVSYFYETFDNSEYGRPVGWIRSILLMLNSGNPIAGTKRCLDLVASKQILLIDSLPIAMKYTSQDRKKNQYRSLVAQSASYLSGKLNHPKIRWGSDVQVALCFKLNAQTMIDVYKEGLKLPTGQTLSLSEDQIIADGSGYPSARKLSRLWSLD
jgi:hypothetical protein